MFFNWDDIDFEDFTFDSLDRPAAVRCGRKMYGGELFQVKAASKEARPFGIYAIQVDFETGGRTKV